MPTTWQIAAGDGDRAYPELCTEWGVILDGPGHLGPWPECGPALLAEGFSRSMAAELRRFCEEIQDGDQVVLKVGLSRVYAIGTVIGPYEWNDQMGDVDGWRIQHVRRVTWSWVAPLGSPQTFPGNPLKIGTTQRLDAPEVLAWMASVVPNVSRTKPLKSLPNSNQGQLNLTELMDRMFFHGRAGASVSALQSQVADIIQLSRWYDARETAPSESETVSHLVMPLLRALGWSSQLSAIEWQRLDIALFDQLPRHDSTLDVVIEVKKRGSSLTKAVDQAMGYVAIPSRSSCRRIVLTDGIRYAIFLRNLDGSWSKKPSAYLNLTRLRSDYPILGCAGAPEAISMLSRDWTPGSGSPSEILNNPSKPSSVKWEG